jgi:Protein-tyrosine phosphatase
MEVKEHEMSSTTTTFVAHSFLFASVLILKTFSLHSPSMNRLVNYPGGRSGVYLAIDANIELAEEEDSFYVFGYLKKLRASRKGLIENVEQYKFVYDTLEEYVVCGNSFFPVADLSQKLKQKSVKDVATKLNEYQKEYAQICKQTPRFSIGDCAGGHRGDNREKNRDVLCVPRKLIAISWLICFDSLPQSLSSFSSLSPFS